MKHLPIRMSDEGRGACGSASAGHVRFLRAAAMMNMACLLLLVGCVSTGSSFQRSSGSSLMRKPVAAHTCGPHCTADNCRYAEPQTPAVPSPEQLANLDSMAECRQEAAELRRRMESMEAELNSVRRSSEALHLAHTTMSSQVERLARDNDRLQAELRRFREVTERQHQSDIASLDALSRLIEQQVSGRSLPPLPAAESERYE